MKETVDYFSEIAEITPEAWEKLGFYLKETHSSEFEDVTDLDIKERLEDYTYDLKGKAYYRLFESKLLFGKIGVNGYPI